MNVKPLHRSRWLYLKGKDLGRGRSCWVGNAINQFVDPRSMVQKIVFPFMPGMALHLHALRLNQANFDHVFPLTECKPSMACLYDIPLA